jgi:NADPH-dependent 2,4-dienoyl-CoA reductase/sulfur reductase-like enzyme
VRNPPTSVAIVGAGIAGTSVLRSLRRLGFEGPVTIAGDEQWRPYDRPPLSKRYLTTELAEEQLLLPVAQDDDETTWRLGLAAVEVDEGRITLLDGSTIDADAVVIATGARPRWPVSLGPRPAEIRVLRTLEDARSLKDDFRSMRHLLVLGGGFIGAELASSARKVGAEVTIVEAQDELFQTSLGPEIGHRLRSLHEQNGVTVRTGVSVVSVWSENGVHAELSDGSTVSGDLAVAGFGSEPNVDVLPTHSSTLTGGIPCDEHGLVAGFDSVWAVGDVAGWTDASTGARHRHEHWTGASDQAVVVAHSLLGLDVPDEAANWTPYFWSDQHGSKLQVLGWPAIATSRAWASVTDPHPGEALEYRVRDRLVGVAVMDNPRLLAAYRAEIRSGSAG